MANTFIFQRIDILGVIAGDTFEQSFLIGEALDLTGCTVRSQVRRYAMDTKVLIAFETEILRLDGQYITLSKTAAGMRVHEGAYVYSALITTAAGQEITLFGGKFEVISQPTK